MILTTDESSPLCKGRVDTTSTEYKNTKYLVENVLPKKIIWVEKILGDVWKHE